MPDIEAKNDDDYYRVMSESYSYYPNVLVCVYLHKPSGSYFAYLYIGDTLVLTEQLNPLKTGQFLYDPFHFSPFSRNVILNALTAVWRTHATDQD